METFDLFYLYFKPTQAVTGAVNFLKHRNEL